MISDTLGLPTDLENVCRDTCAFVRGSEEESRLAGNIRFLLDNLGQIVG
jgi:hypothetical protein